MVMTQKFARMQVGRRALNIGHEDVKQDGCDSLERCEKRSRRRTEGEERDDVAHRENYKLWEGNKG